LAVIGTLFGFLLGYLFHKFLIVMLVMPGLSIGSVISPLSYLLAFVISLAFFAIVDLMFFPRINNLSMIESLKSVE
jgi:putative ABC transport system permease protein